VKMLSTKVLFHLRSARFAADEVVGLLAPYCHKIQIAGSIRRQVPEVHDIDIVVWPHYQETGQLNIFENNPALEPVELKKAIKDNPDFQDYDSEHCAKIIRFKYNYFPVELYLVEPDGNNWEAMLQMRTGSATFNIRVGSEAKKRGLVNRAGYGIFKPLSGERVDDGTEAGILKVLGISTFYLDPKERRS
jgi:DNA polymerase/3'-5' exonuclease PolX